MGAEPARPSLPARPALSPWAGGAGGAGGAAGAREPLGVLVSAPAQDCALGSRRGPAGAASAGDSRRRRAAGWLFGPHLQTPESALSQFASHILYKFSCAVTPVIPALCEAEAGGSSEFRSSRPARATCQNPFSTKKYRNYSGAVACACVPSYLRGEAGGSLETGRRGLQ